VEDVVIAGRYRIRRTLGAGGMGLVYEAEHLETGRSIALKLLVKGAFGGDGADAAKKRFLREARAIGAVESPHVVQVFDAGTDPESGRAFIAMDLLRGTDFGALLKKTGPLAVYAALKIVGQACVGLAAAHQRGILHRDVKPSNIFLCDEGGQVRAKLLDFGIAKITTDARLTEITGSCEVVGTPAYMSPEQARGLAQTAAPSDVWSLGVVLYKAIAGTTPHPTTGSALDQIIALCSDPILPLDQRAAWCPPAIADLVRRALMLDPRDRFSDAGSMLEAIRAIVPDLSLRFADVISAHAPEEARTIAIAGAGPAPVALPPNPPETAPLAALSPPPVAAKRSALPIVAAVLLVGAVTGLVGWRLGTRAEHAGPTPEATPSVQVEEEPATTATAWFRDESAEPEVALSSSAVIPDAAPPAAAAPRRTAKRAETPAAKPPPSSKGPAPALTMESSFE
jgi:serine/threonine protein kinase